MKRKINRESEENWSHKNDYPIEEVWNTYHTLAQLIVPRLQAFKALDKHGFSDKEWKTITEGLDLFCKHYRNLWD